MARAGKTVVAWMERMDRAFIVAVVLGWSVGEFVRVGRE